MMRRHQWVIEKQSKGNEEALKGETDTVNGDGNVLKSDEKNGDEKALKCNRYVLKGNVEALKGDDGALKSDGVC